MVLGNGSKQWIHPSDSLVNGRVTYTVKFIGKAEVPEPRGMPMVKNALKKLSFSRQIKRTEGTKPPKVELGINITSVTISDIKTKEVLHRINLQRVSFCADDKEDKRLFAFIAKLDDNKHYCYGLDSLHQANDITLTIGQAFELAYEKFVKDNPTTPGTKKISDMSKRIQELESENDELRKRIAQLEAAQRANANGNDVLIETKPKPQPISPPSTTNPVIPRRSHPVPSPTTRPQQEAIDIFNMQPFVPASNMTRLPQPPSRKPAKPQDINPWANDIFDPLQFQPKVNKEVMDVQNLWGTSSPDSSQLHSPRSKKSNYHIVSHPLIRKKVRKNQSPALKWSKKYFPSGKRKRSKMTTTGFYNQFSRGMMMSEEQVTLDSFDPLKH